MFEVVDHEKAYDYMFILIKNKEITDVEIESEKDFFRLLYITLPKLG